jgi:4-hydroxybenzoate polyprenyltransferase
MNFYLIKPYLQLIRPKNLLIIAFLQWTLQAWIITPLLIPYRLDLSSSKVAFWFLVIAMILIAAGGYVINAYFDTRIDAINRPDRIIAGEQVSKKAVMKYYIILTALGAIFGFGAALMVHSLSLTIIFFLLIGLLWFYSASYKRQFMIGNLIVAFIVAIVPFSVGFLEVTSLSLRYGDLINMTPIPFKLYAWSGGFALFAFLLTWIREIVKDMEDEPGDRELECRTMPIKWGNKRTKLFLYGLIISTLLLLYYFVTQIHFSNDFITIRYFLIGILMPFGYLFYQLIKAHTTTDFHRAASTLKIIMLIGICYSIIFYFLQATAYQFPFFGLLIIPTT